MVWLHMYFACIVFFFNVFFTFQASDHIFERSLQVFSKVLLWFLPWSHLQATPCHWKSQSLRCLDHCCMIWKYVAGMFQSPMLHLHQCTLSRLSWDPCFETWSQWLLIAFVSLHFPSQDPLSYHLLWVLTTRSFSLRKQWSHASHLLWRCLWCHYLCTTSQLIFNLWLVLIHTRSFFHSPLRLFPISQFALVWAFLLLSWK